MLALSEKDKDLLHKFAGDLDAFFKWLSVEAGVGGLRGQRVVAQIQVANGILCALGKHHEDVSEVLRRQPRPREVEACEVGALL